MAAVAVRGLLLAAIYLVLVGQLSADEIGLALACGLLALAWSLALGRAARLHFRLSAAELGIAGRALARLPRAIIEVAPALLWRRRGSIRREPLARGNRGGIDAGRRAATLLAISLAPDRYALRWAKRGDAVEIHHLSMRAPSSRES